MASSTEPTPDSAALMTLVILAPLPDS